MHGDIAELRIVKTQQGELMKHASSRITDKAFFTSASTISQASLSSPDQRRAGRIMLSNGADALSTLIPSLSWYNGANPHAQPGERVVRTGDMIVMDYGAGTWITAQGMTRTVVVGAPFRGTAARL